MMHKRTAFCHGFAVLVALVATGSVWGTLIVDDFEVDSSANYTVVDDASATSGDGTADSTSTFAFDYIAAGIPLAPNSTAGDSGGLRFTVNDADGETDHITAYHNTTITAPTYTVRVDMYLRVEAAGGTTEHAMVGVAGGDSNFNSLFSPIAGAGHFVAITGDGGSSSDYRHVTPGDGPVSSGDLSYLDPMHTTNASGMLYQSIFPATDFPGSPGNTWTTLTIDVTPSTIAYSLDGTPIIQTATEASSGFVSLGYSDLFTSVGPHFVIFDNLNVEVPEPAAAAVMLSLAGLLSPGRRAKRR